VSGMTIDCILLKALSDHNVLVVDGRLPLLTALLNNKRRGLHRSSIPVDGEVYLYSQLRNRRRPSASSPCLRPPDRKAPFEVTVKPRHPHCE